MANARILASSLQTTALHVARAAQAERAVGGRQGLVLMRMGSLLTVNAGTRQEIVLRKMASRLRAFLHAQAKSHQSTQLRNVLRTSQLGRSAKLIVRVCPIISMYLFRAGLEMILQSALATTGRTARITTPAPVPAERNRSCVQTEREVLDEVDIWERTECLCR